MKQICNNNEENGRSMVEMLGVLAIIGVLSVGGIAGYSKAMMRIRINKTVDQITQISQGIRTLFASQRNYNGLNYTVLNKAKIIPEEMWSEKEGYAGTYFLENAFGGEMRVYTNPMSNEYLSFRLEYYGIPQEACIELATFDWNSSALGLGVLGINIPEGDDAFGLLFLHSISDGYVFYNQSTAIISAEKHPSGHIKSGTSKQMELSQAIAGCYAKDDNNLIWVFK